MAINLEATQQVHTADQKLQKVAGCIIQLKLACPYLLVPPFLAANSPFLAYQVSGSHAGCWDLSVQDEGCYTVPGGQGERTVITVTCLTHAWPACQAPVLRETDWTAGMAPPTNQLRSKGPAALQLAQEPWFPQSEPDHPAPSTQRILMHWGQCPQSSSLYSHMDNRHSSPIFR